MADYYNGILQGAGLDEDRIRELINEHGSALNYQSELDSTSAAENEVVVLTEDITSQKIYTKKLLEITGDDTTQVVSSTLTREAETSATATDFGAGEVGIYNNELVFSASSTEAQSFTDLNSNDEIWIDAAAGVGSFVLRLNDDSSVTTSTRNSVPTVAVSGYVGSVTLTDEVDYVIRSVTSSLNRDAITVDIDGSLHITTDTENEEAFTDLTSLDEIHIVPESGNPFILDLSDSPALGSYSSTNTIMLLARDFTSTPALNIVEDTEYTIYAVKISDEVQGSAFKFDGTLWERLYENVVDSDNIVDRSVDLRDMVTGTVGNVIGYDISGNPADVGATHVITLISTATGTSRLSYNTLKDKPTMSVDTTLWKGTYATGTAYSAGDIVVHSNNLYLFTQAVTTANTEADPADVAGAEQIDIGGTSDITAISYDHPVITLTQRDNTQTTIQIGILRPGDSTLPTSHVKGDLYLMEGARDVDVYTTKLSRTALSSTDNTDFATGIVQHSGGADFFFALDGTDADAWTELESGDKIELVPSDSSNPTIVYTLSGSPTETTRNGVAAITVRGALFVRTTIPASRSSSLVNNESYTIYAMTEYGALHGEIFESDGSRWKSVFTNVIDTENIEEDAVGLDQMASGTAGRVLGYNSSGDPAELDGAPIVDLIEALSGRDRLNYDNIRNKPTIPLDSTIWSGEYAINTAYDAGDIVYDGNNIWLFRVAVPNSNTETDPADVTGAEQIDVGGPNDVTGIAWDDTTKTLTVTVRSGTETEHKLDNTITFGTAFPTDSVEDDVFIATAGGSLETYTAKLSRTAESSSTAGDFDEGEVYVGTTVYFAASISERGAWTDLESGDRIVMVPSDDDNDTLIVSLSGDPVSSVVDGVRVILLTSGRFSLTGTFESDETYTLYALTSNTELSGSVFESDGNYWSRLSDGKITADHIDDHTLPIAKIATGTKDKYLRYNSDGSSLIQADAVPLANSLTTTMYQNQSVTREKMATGTANSLLGYDASGNPISTTRRNVTFGSTTFPTTPHIGDLHIFTAATTIAWKDINGSTDLSDAVKSDVARWNGTNWVKQMTLSEAVSGGGSGTDLHVGTSLPSSHNEGDHFLLESSGNLETYVFKGTRTGETNPAGTQFDAGEVGVLTGTFTMSVSASEETTLSSFVSGDRIVLVPASGSNVEITLTAGFNAGELNTHRVMQLLVGSFTISGTIADNTIYTVYGLRTRSEQAASLFESDGNFFERVYELSVGTAQLTDNSVTLAKMEHVSAGEEEAIIGYNSSGEPTYSRRRSVDFGTGFPTDPAPKEGDVFVFTSDVDSGLTWISESGAALTDANEGDVAYYSAGTWARRINFGSADATGGSGDSWSFGSAYPASPSDEDLFKLSQNGTLERYLTVVPRDAETSTTAGDFGSAEMGIYNGNFIMQASTAEQAIFTQLGSGDEIVAIPSSGDTVTLTLTGSPVSATRNALTAIRVAAADFTIENAFVDGTRYQVYAVDTASSEVKGSVFEYDGNYWARIYENTLTASHIPDGTLSINKLADGTSGQVVGYDSSGSPAELEKTNLIVSGSLSQRPTDAFAKLYLTDDITAENVIVYKSSVTAETATLESEFGIGEVGIFNNDFFWAVGTEAEQDSLIEHDLVVGDIILFTASGQNDVALTISSLNSGVTPLSKGTRNLHRSITIDEDHFTQQGTFVDNQTYSIYFLKNTGTELAGSLYQSTATYWERIYVPDPPKHYIQETFPEGIRDDDTLHLIATDAEAILEYGPITKTAETSTTEGDFAAGEVGVYSNDLVMAVTGPEQEAITELELKSYSNQATAIDLARDDVILFKSDEGDVKITIIANDWGSGTAGSDPYDDDSPVKAGTRNAVTTITIDSTKFNQIGNFVDEREYEVYFIKKNRSQRPDTYYRAKEIDTDEIYWERIYDPSEAQDSADTGTSTVTPNLRQLTQWKRATSTPDAPGNTTLDYEGFYTNFPDTANGWSASVPTGSNALYVATATITRNTAGQWGYNSTWSVTPESSSEIQFWHVTNQAWESSATAGRNSQMRIWTSAGWKIIQLEGEFKLMEKWMSPASVSAVSNIRLNDIDKMRFEIVHFHSQFQISVSRSMLFGEDNSNIGTGTPTSANQATVDNNTVYLYWDYRGAMRIWKKTPNDDVDITNTSVEGMIRINFYKNSEDELTHISTYNPLGRAEEGLGYGALLRIYLEI